MVTAITSLIAMLVFIAIIFLIKTVINNEIESIRNYLISASKLLKTDFHKNQRLTINKNLHQMKKVIITCIIILTVVLVALAGFIVYDNQLYFKNLFESKRQKLNLMKEASVDSLQNIIILRNKKIDSITVINEEKNKQLNVFESKQKDDKKLIESLQNTINNQTKSIVNLSKDGK